MALVKPFAALRPDPALASRLCELPYDVVSSSEARTLAKGNPLSFFHVSKPEIDLPETVPVHDPLVYQQARENFSMLLSQGALRQDATPHFYAYRQIMGSHTQVGIVAVTSCQQYLQNVIRKHELTRPDKEEDRIRHIEALEAQTGPAFLTYPADPQLDDCVRQTIRNRPDVDFVAADGVQHTSWTIADDTGAAIQARFATMPALYIADGHHRTAAAARIYQKRQGAGASGYFLSVLFPADQVQILPYHRALKDLNRFTPEQVLQRLAPLFSITSPGTAQPHGRHEVSLFLAGQWHSLKFREELTRAQDPLEQLDVALLQKHVLAPLFGIDDPRRSERIDFIGGIRGSAELERLVRSGASACAFAMFPTSMAELMAVAEAGRLMPPKSTWFEPKLRDGLFSHLLA